MFPFYFSFSAVVDIVDRSLVKTNTYNEQKHKKIQMKKNEHIQI